MHICFKQKIFSSKGFTLSELIITLGITTIIFILITSIYILNQRAFKKNNDKSEIIQNGRVFIDRISRELRQSPKIVTALTATSTGATSEILFQDGHNYSTEIKYIDYYLEGSNLKRKIIVYYFPSDPGIYVYYNATDEIGNPPQESIQENKIAAEYINSLSFYGESEIINIEANFLKNNENIYIYTLISGRNL